MGYLWTPDVSWSTPSIKWPLRCSGNVRTLHKVTPTKTEVFHVDVETSLLNPFYQKPLRTNTGISQEKRTKSRDQAINLQVAMRRRSEFIEPETLLQ